MPRPTEIQNIIEEAVAEVLDAALPRLRSEIVRRAVEVVESLAPAPGASPSDLLNAAAAGTVPGGTLDSSGLQALTRFAAIWLELAALRKAGGSSPTEEVVQPAAAMAASASATAASGSEEDELHKKARRFAKLLVEEIKLYNQPRVEEGRQHKDLYDRLKVDIEKSRSTYDKRYAESAVASADYFTQELIRILADNDASLMGASFPRS